MALHILRRGANDDVKTRFPNCGPVHGSVNFWHSDQRNLLQQGNYMFAKGTYRLDYQRAHTERVHYAAAERPVETNACASRIVM